MTEATTSDLSLATRVNAILSRYRDPLIAAMRQALDRPSIEHVRLMRYHLGWEDAAGAAIEPAGGKMLRPALCLLCCEAASGDVAHALPAAAAIELLHNFTLIHDDIEDASSTRHGRPTLWTRVGVPLAINAGDGMFVLAQRTLLHMADAGVPAERVLHAARVLDEACVTLCEGQHLDIGFEARDSVSIAEYEAMIGGKTAALLGASCAIGAIAAGADDATVAAFGECGRLLGFAFQVQDDVLGIWGESQVTGKSASDDIRSRKKSFPAVWAFDHLDPERRTELASIYAKDVLGDADVAIVVDLLDSAGAREAATERAASYARDALAALAPLQLDPDPRAEIEALAAFFVQRSA